MRKNLRLVKLWMTIIFFLSNFASLLLQAQSVYNNSTYTNSTQKATLVLSERVTLDLPNAIPINPAARVDTAVLFTQLDLGESYAYGNIAFKAEINFSLQAESAATQNICSSCKLIITSTKPQALYVSDIASLAGFDRIALIVESIQVEATHSNATIKARLEAEIKKELRVGLSYQIGYGIDVKNINLNAGQVVTSGKVATFYWNETFAPNHEFQLIRLYNKLDPNQTGISPALKQKILEDKTIVTDIDWAKALTIETQSSSSSVSLTIGEGSGYYAFRVRPIGSFFKGGIANGKNHGNWSNSSLGVNKEINTIDTPVNIPSDDYLKPLAVFNFKDPDEKINNIYSRTFTEGNRVSEKITYASQLQQVKQSQTYLPSQKKGITSQTIYDYSNRPAITTLPVPKTDSVGLRGYKKQFVLPNTTSTRPDTLSPYQAYNFDRDANYRNPSLVNQKDTDFTYYTGKKNVADAEGYPMSRTLFDNDGSNRVKEQSGVGRTHMVSDSVHMGKTVKTSYGTASEDELVRLFGDEAPQETSVIKTITIDQNNTATITYTSKEGKVIATSMSFQQQGNLLPVSGNDAAQNVIINDKITANSSSGAGIVSNKRIAIIDRTPLDLTYKIDTCNSTIEDCNKIKANCSYELRILVQKIDGAKFSTQSASPNYVAIGAVNTLKKWAFIAGDSTTLISIDTTVSCTNQASLVFNKLTLPPGTYMVEKRLIPRGGEVIVEAAQEKVDAQIKPLSNMIKGWLDKVTCDKNIKVFYQDLRDLQRWLDSVKTICTNNAGSCAEAFNGLDNLYKLKGLAIDTAFFNSDYSVSVFPANGIPQQVTISSRCCQNLVIPIDYVPTFDFDKIDLTDIPGLDNNGKPVYYKVNPFLYLDERKTEFFPDLEGYAFGYFWDCTPIGQALIDSVNGLSIPASVYSGDRSVYDTYTTLSNTQKDSLLTLDRNKIKYIYHNILKPYMDGWEVPGTFNLMAHHMLTDKYSCDGKNANGSTVSDRPGPVNNPCGASSAADCIAGANNTFNCVHYHVEDLFNCWVAQLGYLKDNLNLCPNPTGAKLFDSEQQEPPYKVSDGMDKENKGDGTVHDDHVDTNFKGNFIVKFFAKRKIKKLSKRLRNLQGAPDPAGDGGDMSGETPISANFKYHIIREFLGCSGYRFAKILTDAPAQQTPLTDDIITGVTYSVPAIDTVNSYNGIDRGYLPNKSWKASAYNDTENLFTAIKDPVYAYKYFEYEDESRPEIEVATCYHDPNICYDTLGNAIPCCPNGTDNLCNFCGIGKIICEVTKKDWTCGQRNTFYELLKNYQKSEPIDWSDDGLVCEDYTSPGYVEDNKFYVWEDTLTYDAAKYELLKNNDFKLGGKRLKTKVEIDIEDLNRGLYKECESKRAVYRQTLVDTLLAKGYLIGGCKASPTDNIVPWEDVDTLVSIMIAQCKQRGLVTTFTCVSDSCRDIYTPKTFIGHVDTLGARIDINRLEYGVENSEHTSCAEAVLLYRPNLTAISFTATTDTLTAPASFSDSTIIIRDCNGNTFTYCEWTKRREVTEMALSLDIPPYGNPSYQTPCQTGGGVDCPPANTADNNPNIHNNTSPDAKEPTKYVPKQQSSPVGVQVKIKEDNTVEVNQPSNP